MSNIKKILKQDSVYRYSFEQMFAATFQDYFLEEWVTFHSE